MEFEYFLQPMEQVDYIRYRYLMKVGDTDS